MPFQPGAGLLGFGASLRKAQEALGRVLFGTRAGPQSAFGDSIAAKVALTAILLAAVAALRLELGAHTIGFSAAIFFPVILTCALFAGWAYGVAALIGCTIIAWMTVHVRTAGTDAGVAVFVLSGGVQVALAAFARAMLLDREILRHRMLKLIDASQGFAFVLDTKGRPLEPHPRWAALTGMQWEKYRGRGWMQAIHPDDRKLLPLHGLPNESKSLLMEVRIRDGASGDWRWHRLRTVPMLKPDGAIREWIGTLDDIHERRLETEKREIVASELRHRLKNLMAIVEALAKYSAPRRGTDAGVDDFLKRFTGRLHALTAASDLVLAGHAGAVEANAVIRATLEPFTGDRSQRVRIEGPDLQLSEEFGGGLAMAIHELATNAIKYGALSVTQGSVAFVWTVTATSDGEDIVFDWKERDGPPPIAPGREGFGTRMIKAVTARENTGAVTIEYEPDGLHCRISFTRVPKKAREA
jgi:PAS domain S-box-containing protein